MEDMRYSVFVSTNMSLTNPFSAVSTTRALWFPQAKRMLTCSEFCLHPQAKVHLSCLVSLLSLLRWSREYRSGIIKQFCFMMCDDNAFHVVSACTLKVGSTGRLFWSQSTSATRSVGQQIMVNVTQSEFKITQNVSPA